jgi:transposase
VVGVGATDSAAEPVYYVLEDDFELLLVNAAHVKNLPGRKTDMADAQWMCQLLEHGLLHASFVPPKPIRQLRDLTGYRHSLAERQREANRLQKVLEDAGIKLSCVATDVLGVSGRAMLAALIDGTDDAATLAELGKGRTRTKRAQLHQVLQVASTITTGCWSRTRSDTPTTSTKRLTRSPSRSRRVWSHTPTRPCAWTRSPASAPRTAQIVLAEVGPTIIDRLGTPPSI